MDTAETYWIGYFDTIKNGYNIKEGGSHGKHSAETKQKMSLARQGKVHSKESKKQMSLAAQGKVRSVETKQKMSLAHQGRVRSAESKKKQSLAQTHQRPFCDQNGAVYRNVPEAVRILGFRQAGIWKVLQGCYKSTGGYTFKYLEK
jgi:hypothetical protein